MSIMMWCMSVLVILLSCFLFYNKATRFDNEEQQDEKRRELLTRNGESIHKRRTVTVQGHADVFVAPDICLITFTRETIDMKSVSTAFTENGRVVKEMSTIVSDAGIEDKDVQTTNLAIGPTYRFDYVDNRQQKVFEGYRVTQDMTVKVRDMTKISSLLDACITAGATEVKNVQFTVENPRKYSEAVRVAALEEALKKATKICEVTGMTLGQPITITEVETDGPQEHLPVTKMMRMEASLQADSGGGDATAVAKGEIKLTHTVHIVYEMSSLSSSFERKNGMQMVIEKRAKADELPTFSGKPLAVQALKLYKDLNVLPSQHEKWTVPYRFVVPSGNFSWPESLWGMKLGSIASNIKRGRNYKDDRMTLELLGMDFANRYSEAWDRTYAALKLYKDLYVPSHQEKWTVPFRFVVPHGNASWPQTMWGMHLGRVVNKIKLGESYKSQRVVLENLGLDLTVTVRRHNDWDKIYAALKLYKDLHVPIVNQDNWTISTKYVVPHNETTWPEEMWGMKLGQAVTNIRRGRDFKSHRSEFEKLGLGYSAKRQTKYSSDPSLHHNTLRDIRLDESEEGGEDI